ncbi:MAG: UTP--glucose-1-phosphate uridylyltransferase [Malacoplasma sp.]|nr:UTP--glucose-1-phosphate uridylyltransferase [Malacoplasma sp.]
MKKTKKEFKITKLVLPVAGLGTRFLPQTKYLAKEMFPVLNTPIMHYLVNEAIESGIKEIIVVLSRRKNSIVEYFSNNYNAWKGIKIHLVYQENQEGLGHAILCAEDYCKNEPFAILLGDDIFFPRKGQVTPLKQCMDIFHKYKSPVVGVQEVPDSDVPKYGILGINRKLSKNTILVKNLIEKPKLGKNPSNYAILGRYILTPDIFREIKRTKKDKSNEIQLTDAIQKLIRKTKVYGCIFTGDRFDTGNVLGYVKALTYAAAKSNQINSEYIDFVYKLFNLQ